MATIEENRIAWDCWEKTGDEWSKAWGGTESEWYFTIFPRIHSFVPAETILEIAPGHGRWTRFLKNLCKNLILVDLSKECIRACKDEFKAHSHITYHVNDGISLDMIRAESIDFVFSFDSLVHAEEDVIQAYLDQLGKKLKQNGVGFIHHSNLGAYKIYFSILRKIPEGIIKRVFRKIGIIESSDHWRARSMTVRKFAGYAEKAGLRIISQEMITWGTKNKLIDCISVFTRKDSNRICRDEVMRNVNFMKEARQISCLSRLYSSKG